MKKRPEDDLLGDVFPKSADFRAASLEQMLCAARQQRRRRTAFHVSGIVTLTLGLFVLLLNTRHKVERAPTQVATTASPHQNNFPTVPGTSIRVLSDEELLTLFADRPVALIGPAEDRHFVVLDEVRKEKANGALNL